MDAVEAEAEAALLEKWKRKQESGSGSSTKILPRSRETHGVNSLPRIQHIAVNERMILRVEIRKGVD